MIRRFVTIAALGALFVLAGCNLPGLPGSAPGPARPLPEATGEIAATANPVYRPPTAAPTQPGAAPAQPAPAGALAYLKDGDLYLAELPSGAPLRLTQGAGLVSFAWSPSGRRLATFDGRKLCFLGPDGSSAGPCQEVGLDPNAVPLQGRLAWAPDERSLAIWNNGNPWDEGAVGWLVAALDGSGTVTRIDDPVDWGLDLAPNNDPGGVVGQAVYLPDGTLVGALTHRYVCAEAGCPYGLYRFDPQAGFFPYPEGAPSAAKNPGPGLALSADGRLLAAFGLSNPDCAAPVSRVNVLDRAAGGLATADFAGAAIAGLELLPGGSQAIAARTAACTSPEQAAWAVYCGLSAGPAVLPMQVLDLASGGSRDLVPGLDPDLDPSGARLAFRSCLAPVEGGGWQAAESGPPSIYVLDLGSGQVALLDAGSAPQWRP